MDYHSNIYFISEDLWQGDPPATQQGMKATVDIFSPKKVYLFSYFIFLGFFLYLQLSEELENKTESYDFVDYLFVFVGKMEVKSPATFYIQTLSGTNAHYLYFILSHHPQYFRTP